jgi:hypothetical protein
MLSGVCLAHCLAAPALVALIPAFTLGLNHELDRALHASLLGLALPISLWSLRHGIRTHGQYRWLGVGAAGLSLMLAGVLLHTPSHSEMWLTVAGVVVLALAHLMNWRSTTRMRPIVVRVPDSGPRSSDCHCATAEPARRAA